ncbi:MAG TPA: hypothetical protein VLS88_11680 [Polyangiales bacterium]|nr:hypothetical protein [Polyangiales bacterium]
MRLLLVGFLLCSASACGDDGPYWTHPPKALDSCGELEDVDPIAPEVVGQDDFGCPVFAPVPCVEPSESYEALCGANCRPKSMFDADGDAWLVGCEAIIEGPDGCVEIEPPPRPVCLLDPFGAEEYWLFFGSGCRNDALFSPGVCWATCDPVDDGCFFL